jgi:hypothetical protein
MKILNIVWLSAGDCRRDRHRLVLTAAKKGEGMIPPELGERRVREAWFNAIPWSNIDGPEKRAKDKIHQGAAAMAIGCVSGTHNQQGLFPLCASKPVNAVRGFRWP